MNTNNAESTKAWQEEYEGQAEESGNDSAQLAETVAALTTQLEELRNPAVNVEDKTTRVQELETKLQSARKQLYRVNQDDMANLDDAAAARELYEETNSLETNDSLITHIQRVMQEYKINVDGPEGKFILNQTGRLLSGDQSDITDETVQKMIQKVITMQQKKDDPGNNPIMRDTWTGTTGHQ